MRTLPPERRILGGTGTRIFASPVVGNQGFKIAFTLIELLVVIAILAILAAILLR